MSLELLVLLRGLSSCDQVLGPWCSWAARWACPLAVCAALPPVAELAELSAAGSAWSVMVDVEQLSAVRLMRPWAVGQVSAVVAETQARLDCRGFTDVTSARSMVLHCHMLVFQRTQTWSHCSGCIEITVALADWPWIRTTSPTSGQARAGPAWVAARGASVDAGSVS